MRRLLYIFSAAALLLNSCSKESDLQEQLSNTAVQFTTSITKASGTTWDAGDQVGVFMTTTGQTLGASNLATNVLYTTSGGVFASTSPIYYPMTGAADFVAYYPYRANPATNPDTYKVDVATQTNPAAIDLLWATAVNKSSSANPVALEFNHKLSRVVLNIKAGTGMGTTDLSGVSARITGMPTTADFALADGTFSNPSAVANITPISATTPTSGYAATRTAIVVPQETANTFSGRKMIFTMGTMDYEYAIPDTELFVSGKSYAYEVTINARGLSVNVQEITSWTQNGTTENGNAYICQVGDYYPDRNAITTDGGATWSGTRPVGIVFRVKTATQSGLVVSLDAIAKEWSTEEEVTNATSGTNGVDNMRAIQTYLNNNGKEWALYPAFDWCRKYGNGTPYLGQWYLPAKDELRTLVATSYGKDYSTIANWADIDWMPGHDSSNPEIMAARTAFNDKFTSAGGTEFHSFCWSSTAIEDVNDDFTMIQGRLVDMDYGMTMSQSKLESFNVRAVLAF